MPPFISFLSDYGLQDDFVGVCHSVIAGICPEARIVDLTHGIRAHDVAAGALVLEAAIAYMPAGVHLAVVDPGVGSERRAVALRCGDGRCLVGPDNGLLTPAASAAGGIVEAVDVGDSPFALRPISATFHGRDLFAPVAARLAAGAELAQAGTPVDLETLITARVAPARLQEGALVADVRYVDAFGNLQLNATAAQLAPTGATVGASLTVSLPDGTDHDAVYGHTFADAEPGELVVYEDAQRRLAVALNRDSAADRLGLEVQARLRIAP
jgi:S-adenosylmethionine hydrolase